MLRTAAGLGAGMAFLSMGSFLLWHRNPTVMREDQLIEWSQAGFLLLGAGVYGWLAFRTHRFEERALCWGAGLFLLSLSSREVDIDKLATPAVEAGVRAGIVLLWVAWAWSVRSLLPTLPRFGFRTAVSPLGLVTAAGCGLYMASWFFDKHPEYFGVKPSLAMEETIQLNATFLLMCAAWLRSPFQAGSEAGAGAHEQANRLERLAAPPAGDGSP